MWMPYDYRALDIQLAFIKVYFDSLEYALLYAIDHQYNRKNQETMQRGLNAIKGNALVETIERNAMAHQRQAGRSCNRI